jgi:prepilin-type N-terminal cleavage/methylation domain-containing protein
MIAVRTDRFRPAGFSLVELLVVIGIIVLLLGILIPVVSRVRQAAWSANTQNTLANISGAIERYHMDHQAYPGLVADNVIATPPGHQFPAASGPVSPTGPITTSENLVLSLMGGIRYQDPTNLSSPLVFDPAEVGPGARDLSNNRRIAAYIDEQAGGLAPQPWDASSGLPGATDSIVPEFLDRFPDPMPIIYVRARTGASGVIGTTSDGPRQYNVDHLSRYFTFPGTTPAEQFNAAVEYFAHPTLNTGTLASIAASGTPRAKDAYMLISPGRDRVYGSPEDITYPPR